MAKRVSMNIAESGYNNEKTEYEVIFVNGTRYQIKKGEDVEVPPVVKEVYNESNKFLKQGNTQKKPLIIEG